MKLWSIWGPVRILCRFRGWLQGIKGRRLIKWWIKERTMQSRRVQATARWEAARIPISQKARKKYNRETTHRWSRTAWTVEPEKEAWGARWTKSALRATRSSWFQITYNLLYGREHQEGLPLNIGKDRTQRRPMITLWEVLAQLARRTKRKAFAAMSAASASRCWRWPIRNIPRFNLRPFQDRCQQNNHLWSTDQIAKV